ncbi:cytochrome aa3 quinol oxidase subunit III [Ammoniphilus sp. YIM 78166]|uniref:cytochrome aa3 quinol oxidase subunit III n=1 Tax=Ammoniphilus sp. YIM 78166 TaxID=1644106 RepID=UPI00106FE980|nr:cytochrome aa3 quinol oxidase subunit III [Ammoniphilus sp. YIM 78166]
MSAKVNTALPLEYQTLQNQMNILGFWIFLGAEIVLFATLFGVYGVLGTRFADGPILKDLIVMQDVYIQTVLLLVSSFTCGIAIFEMRRHNVKGLMTWLIITLGLGAGFLFMEIREFLHYIHAGATIQTSAAFSSFFALLGTHGLHVTLGICWAIAIMVQIKKRGLTSDTARKVFIIGLYWHFLDVVWIFIYTFVYLKGAVA